MTGRHARRSRLRFAAAAVVLIVIIGGITVAATRNERGDATEGSADAATRTTSVSPTSAARVASDDPDGVSLVPSPKMGRLVIHGTGDVSLDPSYIPAFRSNGYGWAWSGLDGLFREDDLTVINLECPLTDVVDPESKEFVFRCDPAALPAARRHGVEVANQGNNHAYDQGPEGLLDSLRNIRAAGLAPIGAGRDQEDALAPALFDIDGWKVAALGFDEVLDPLYEVAGPSKPGTAAGHDFSLMVQAVRRAARRADVVVVMIHWGVELDTQPRSYQIEQGHRLIDAGADVIFGGHSHRLQPLSIYRGRPIFWSLGNFVWPHLSTEGSITAVAQVIVTPRGRFRATLLPAYIAESGHPVLR